MPEDVKPDPALAGGEPKVDDTPALKTWLDDLPDDLKAEKTLSKFKSIADLAKGYVNLEKYAGSAVRIPGEKATPEELAAFREKLGVPKTPDEYGVEAKVPEGMPWNKDAEKAFLRRMHAHGLTPAQAQGILDDYVAMVAESAAAQAQEKSRTAEAAYAAVAKQWGGLTDRNIALVQRTVAEFGGDEFKAYLEETGLGNDPRFLMFVHAVAQPLLEDNIIKGENLGMRRAEAQAEIARLMKDPGYLKGDKDIIRRISDLVDLAHAEV